MEGDFWSQAVGYVQAEPIRPTPVPGASEDFDAIACYMVRDDAFEEHPPEATEAERIAQLPEEARGRFRREIEILEGDGARRIRVFVIDSYMQDRSRGNRGELRLETVVAEP